MTLEDLKQRIWRARQKGWRSGYCQISEYPNPFYRKEDKYNSFELSLECGKSYLYGSEMTMKEFLRKKGSLNVWQKIVFEYLNEHPDKEIIINIDRPRLSYSIYKRGEYVDIGLPHHDAGGERNWITKDGKYKYLVNVD